MRGQMIAIVSILFCIVLLLCGFIVLLVIILCRRACPATSNGRFRCLNIEQQTMNTSRPRWSWRSCFALVKHNKKSRKLSNPTANSQKSTSVNARTAGKAVRIGDESLHLLPASNKSSGFADRSSETSLSQTSEPSMPPSTCIIRIEAPSDDENEHSFIDGDTIQPIVSDLDSPTVNHTPLASTRTAQLDAIVEDSNEESADELEEALSPSKLCCDREIVDDANTLHSRLVDLSQMNHVKAQFSENGNLLSEFVRQLDKLQLRTNDIVRASAQMPRDAELLEARYSSLTATIESLSILLKIAQIPACRALLARLQSAIEQRTEQLNKLVQLTSMSLHSIQQRLDSYDDDFSSFRSALSSYEHLFTASA